MRIFQFFFNPQIRDDLILDSFCYEPENIYEKRLGSLYMVGALKNALPKDKDFLEKIGKFIKERYYKKVVIKPERALKETLKEVNDLLADFAKKGNVNWLGNLSFSILNLKNFNLNFTKVGEIKIFLKRGKKILDIDKRLKLQDIEPYPLKVFGKIVSGKLIDGDLVLVFSEEIFDFFQKAKFFQQLREVEILDEKELKKFFEEKKENLKKIKGILFILSLVKERGGKKEIISPKISKEFSLKNFFFALFSPLLKFERKKEEFNFSKIFFPFKKNLIVILKNRKLLLVLIFVLILLLGYLLF